MFAVHRTFNWLYPLSVPRLPIREPVGIVFQTCYSYTVRSCCLYLKVVTIRTGASFGDCQQDKVTFYHVYFADAQGIAQWTEQSWTLDAPPSANDMLHIDTWQDHLGNPSKTFPGFWFVYERMVGIFMLTFGKDRTHETLKIDISRNFAEASSHNTQWAIHI